MTASRYQSVRLIESTATADVLLARQEGLAGFERLVVVKRLPRHLVNDSQYLGEFLEGVRLSGHLVHPSIVQVLDVQETDEVVFVVVEYVSGESLASVAYSLRGKRLVAPVPIVCRIIADCASALSYAQGAVDLDGGTLRMPHGELTPDKITIAYSGATKVADFGIASANSHNIHTKSGELLRKLAYASPEHIRHRSVDERSDLFSLGIVFYELLTGDALFAGDSPGVVIREVMEARIPTPTERNPDVPEPISDLVMKLLVREPEHRMQSAAQLVHELNTTAASLGILVGEDDVGQFMREQFANAWHRRRGVEQAVLSGVDSGISVASASVSVVPSMFTPTEGADSALSDSQLAPKKSRNRLAMIVAAGVAVMLPVAFAFWLGLSGGPPPTAPSSEPPRAGLLIRATPHGATVHVDGILVAQQLGQEGVFVPRLDADVAEVRIELEGYFPVVDSVLSPAVGTNSLRFTLQPTGDQMVVTELAPPSSLGPGPNADDDAASAPSEPSRDRPVSNAAMGRTADGSRGTAHGRLTVRFEPANAVVTVDGREVAGASPLSIEVPAGTHQIVVAASGRETMERSVRVAPDQTIDVTTRLRPQTLDQAVLDIVTTPAGATITVSGRRRGESPVSGIALAPNETHLVTASLDGYRTWSARVTPIPGVNRPLRVSLQAVPEAEAAAPVASVQRDITLPLGSTGNPSAGRSLFTSRCGRCHGRTAGPIGPRRYTTEQWSRYFATGRHGRRALLSEHFSRSQLADVNAYLGANAANVETDRAAGVQ